jgi:hypothetical protein
MSTGMPNVPSDRLRSTRGDLYGDDCRLLLPIKGNDAFTSFSDRHKAATLTEAIVD